MAKKVIESKLIDYGMFKWSAWYDEDGIKWYVTPKVDHTHHYLIALVVSLGLILASIVIPVCFFLRSL